MQVTLTVETGEQAGDSFSLQPGAPAVVGSAPGIAVRLAGPGVAPQHAALLLGPEGLQAVDLGHGTRLDGQALPPRQPAPVRDGQALEVAGVVVRVEVTGASAGGPASAAHASAAATSATGRLRLELPPEEYEVVRELGRGAMGVVVQAVRRADGRPVAVKVLHEAVPPGSPDHERFLTEGRVGQRIRSPHVVEVLDLRVGPSGQAWIVLELVPGPSVEGALRAGRPAPARALEIAEHVARGLAAAAAAGVVHRDVKPANVLLHPSGAAKLTDFGIAKDFAGTVRSLTLSGMGLGTLAYMAPEAIDGAKHVTPAADLYSLGAMLFELLAGRPPFVVRSPEQLVQAAQQPAPPLEPLVPGCPPDLAGLVAALLAKEPWDRPGSAAEVAGWLAALRARLGS